MLEAALINGEQIGVRETSLINIVSEVVRLIKHKSTKKPGDEQALAQDDAIQEVCSGVCAYSQS
jgi:hypothetical protein